jgi:transcriptional regulator with AAA-type ATPase domain
LITYEGETYSEAHWAKKLGINLHEFKKRLNKFGLDYQTFAPCCAIDSRFIIWQDKRKTKQRWARELGIDYSTFIYRLRKYGICDRTFLMKNGNVLK